MYKPFGAVRAQKKKTERKKKKEREKSTLCLEYYIHVGLFKPLTKEVPTDRPTVVHTID